MQKQKMKQEETQSQKQEQKTDLAQTVDYAFSLNKEIRAKQEELKIRKNALKEQAEARGVKEIEGYESKVVFSPEETTEIDAHDLYYFLLNNGFDLDTFFNVVKVKVGNAKNVLGYVLLDEVSKTEFKEYAKSNLKPKKKED